MTDAKCTAPDEGALAEAAKWFVELASGTADEEALARWRRWRDANPVHQQAWARVETVSDAFAAVPQQRSMAAVQALTAKKIGGRLLSTLLIALVGLTGWQGYRSSDWSADVVTAVGKQTTVSLVDGSRVVLDSNGAMDIHFDDERRLIHLRRGRVLIETGHEQVSLGRPFTVATGEGEITALGTQFTVERLDGYTRVAVIEARVAVLPADTARDRIVDQGQSTRFTRSGIVETSTVDRNDAAWARGVLIADAMPLAELASALDRYRRDQLVCDRSVAALRISGSFPLGDTERVLAAIAETLPVRIDRSTAGVTRLRKK